MSHEPSVILIRNAAISQLILLVIKIVAVYYTIDYLIPRWLKQPAKLKFYVEAFVVMCCFIAIYRMMIHWVIWPYITKAGPSSLTTLQYVARLFYSIFDLLQVVGIAAAIKLFRLRLAAIRNEKLLTQEKLRSEMLHLRSQVNPHFLFNMLNSIYALSRSQSPATPEVVLKLSRILQFMLYETGRRTISIQQEIKVIRDYIELQELRFGKRMHVQLTVNLDEPEVEIAPLLIFPLLENAFKHGNGEGNAEIQVGVELKSGMLMVKVSNPVVSASVASTGEEGIGLPNLRRQLELLYRDYSFVHEIRNNLFCVDLQINLLSYVGFELFDSRG